MRDLLIAWRRLRDILEEAEEVHATIAKRKDPSITDVLAPLAYKRLFGDQESTIVGIAGRYLERKYPELRTYLLTPTQRSRPSDLHTQLALLLNETDETPDTEDRR